jgi:RNA polymerase sigma-70 factor, ECF subfamily
VNRGAVASTERDDAVLLSAAQAGDRGALDELLRRHIDYIHAVCRRLAGNDADGDDATQEALLAIARGIGRFDGRSSLRTWLYRVATNACLDELRRRARRPVTGLPEMEADVGDGPSVADTVADRITLDEALLTLPPEFRAAVVLRDVVGMDYAEIAATLAIPPGTVRSRIARGRAALAAVMRGNRPPAPDRPSDRP